MTLKSDTKFGEESTCGFKIDLRNLTNFDVSTRKSQNFHCNGLLLSPFLGHLLIPYKSKNNDDSVKHV